MKSVKLTVLAGVVLFAIACSVIVSGFAEQKMESFSRLSAGDLAMEVTGDVCVTSDYKCKTTGNECEGTTTCTKNSWIDSCLQQTNYTSGTLLKHNYKIETTQCPGQYNSGHCSVVVDPDSGESTCEAGAGQGDQDCAGNYGKLVSDPF